MHAYLDKTVHAYLDKTAAMIKEMNRALESFKEYKSKLLFPWQYKVFPNFLKCSFFLAVNLRKIILYHNLETLLKIFSNISSFLGVNGGFKPRFSNHSVGGGPTR